MELIEDLVQIQLLNDQDYQQVINAISAECSGLDWGILVQNFSKQDNGESIQALIRFLNFLSENIAESRNYAKQIEEVDNFLTKLLNDEADALVSWNRIKNSLTDLENFFLHQKEEAIQDKFSRISSFKVITDIRPIFNMDKKSISKLTYPNILKIETKDGKEFLCEFYEDAIDKLIEELNIAKDKLKMLKESYGG